VARNYRIVLDVDTRSTDQRVKAANAVLAQTAAQAARAATAVENAEKRKQAAAERAQARQTAIAEKEAATRQRIIDKAITREMNAQTQAQVKQTAIADKEAMSRQRIIDRAVTREMNAQARLIQQQDRDASRATQRATREADRRAVNEAKAAQRIADQRKRIERDLDADIARQREKIETGGDPDTALTKLMKFGAAVGVIKGVAQAFIDFNENIIQSSRLVTEYQEALRELAALRGHPGDTGEEMRADLEFRAKTKQTAQESRALREEAYNVGQVSIDTVDAAGKVMSKGVMDPKEFEQAVQYTGMMQSVYGGDAKVMGQMIGTIPQIAGKGRMTGKEAFTYQSQLFDIFQLGGFSASAGAQQFSTIAPYIGPDLMGGQQAAALMAAYSNRDPARGATRVEQMVRATVGAQGRMRGARLEGIDTQKTGEYLKSIGADKLKDPVAVMKKISDDLMRAGYDPNKKEEDMTEDELQSVFTYLGSKGYGGQEEKQAILGFHQMRKNFEEKFQPLIQGRGGLPEGDPRRRAGKTYEEAITPIEVAQRANPVLQERETKLAGDIANVAEAGGAGTFDRRFRAMFEIGRAQGRIYAAGGKYEDLSSIGFGNLGGLLNIGYNSALQGDVLNELSARGQRAGLPRFQYGLTTLSARGRGAEIQAYENRIAAAGGEKFDATAQIAAANRQLDEQKKATAAAEKAVKIQQRRANQKETLTGITPPSGSRR
jgi:hypothetical protein